MSEKRGVRAGDGSTHISGCADDGDALINSLRESQYNLAKSQEMAHLGSWTWDLKSNMQAWSDERYRIFGLAPGELEPTFDVYMSFVHPDDRPSVENTISEAIRGKKPFIMEYRIVRKDGSIRYMHSEGQIANSDKGEPLKMFAIGQDITEQKRTEWALRDSEERFRTLANNIPNLAWMAKPDGWIFWYNKQWYDYTGTTPEEMQGWGWQKVHHPDYVRKVTDEWRSRIEAGQRYDNIFPLRRKDGNYRWFLTRVTPIRDEQGNIQRWLGTNTDITELKQAQDDLKEAKIQADLYLDIMGHDINNLNQVTIGNLDLIKDDSNLTVEQKEMITDALNASMGSAGIIDNVRRIQAINEETVVLQQEDINEMIMDCIKGAPKPADKKVTINYTPRKGLMINGTALVKEVFCNLIYNAIKHSVSDVVIDVSVDAVEQENRKFYNVSVADNGPGIPDEIKSKIFHRFQRGATKATGRGLGLFIARSLVEINEGNIVVEDRVPGNYSKGAKFVVSLPASEECK